jgi:hypothetical protein
MSIIAETIAAREVSADSITARAVVAGLSTVVTASDLDTFVVQNLVLNSSSTQFSVSSVVRNSSGTEFVIFE